MIQNLSNHKLSLVTSMHITPFLCKALFVPLTIKIIIICWCFHQECLMIVSAFFSLLTWELVGVLILSLICYGAKKNMSQALRKYGTQITKNSQPTYVQKPMPAKIQAIFMISTIDALYGSYAFQHNFLPFITQRCTFCQKFLVSPKSPDRYSLLVAVIPLNHW